MANDAQAQAPAIDWNQLLQLFSTLLPVLLPLIQSLFKKSAFAAQHGLPDPLKSFAAFVDDYAAVHKAMA